MACEEINPASVVREFLIISGMEVSSIREPSAFYEMYGPYFFVRLPSNDLMRIDASLNAPVVRVSPASRHKVPAKHFKRNGMYWMNSDEHMDFNLAVPGSLEKIFEFLNP